ncbi:MAG: hypothetical protein K9K38_03885 [Rhodoferax sp.]|nr:hypothetical protein [Rhodoferax sp.]MCF8208535.1 hypothetical protein [Rhodoferax sp.]
MLSKLKYVLGAVVGLAASAGAIAGDLPAAADPEFRLAVIASPHKTELKTYDNAMQPKEYSNGGNGFYGFLGEANFGKVSLSVDYLTGTSNTVPGGLDFTPNSPTFTPLTHANTEVLTILGGYNVVNHPLIGKLDVTLGYFRLWEQLSVAPANWFDGLEIGIKGRRSWDDKFALTYKLGYVPDMAVHGYVKDSNMLIGKNVLNLRLGAEVPVYKNISVVAGYERTAAEDRFVIDDSKKLTMVFSGFYIGCMVNF